jgi:hypothetical protein
VFQKRLLLEEQTDRQKESKKKVKARIFDSLPPNIRPHLKLKRNHLN